MGSIIGHRIDYDGVGAPRGQRHIPSKINPSTPRTNNKLNPDMTSTPGLESRLLWWEARALTTTPPLAQKKQCDLFSVM